MVVCKPVALAEDKADIAELAEDKASADYIAADYNLLFPFCSPKNIYIANLAHYVTVVNGGLGKKVSFLRYFGIF